ncbi:MAG TPA: hypothetical protein VFQ79_10115 [Bryobacteraceae bacterium]|nr:hypothetical protein [Bryobacteraceae bacterium]
MIHQLIRREPAWKATPWLALASAVAWSWMPSMFGFAILVAGLVAGMPHRHATRLDAGLPIEARDLLLARTFSLMAVIWIPALAGAASIVIVKGFSASASDPLAAAALGTLIAAVAQALRLKELAGPKWLFFLYFAVNPSGLALLKQLDPLVPLICALSGAALFIRAWVTVPPSFQLTNASVNAWRPARQERRVAPRAAFRWAPVLRSVCSWQYVFFVPWMGYATATGQWLFLPFWLVVAWRGPRNKTRWLWALPVGRRALLWTMMGPILAAHVLGYLAGFRFHQRAAGLTETRVIVVTLAAILGYVMLTILLCVLFDWRGFARIPRRTLHIVFLLLAIIWYLASFALLYFGPEGEEMRDVLGRVGRTAPMGVPALIATATAALIALYWAIERVFSQPDFAGNPRVSDLDAIS